MTTNDNNQEKLPTVLELQEHIKEIALYCDELQKQIRDLETKLAYHEHGKSGVMLPLLRE